MLTVLVLAAPGCLQLETHIRFHEDGSATVTERLSLSRALLDMAKGDGAGARMETFLTREAAADRARQMGKGITLASHELRDGEKGSRESLAVYRVPDLTEFEYVSPFVGARGYQAQSLRFSIHPNLAWAEWARRGLAPGTLILTFTAQKSPDAPGAARKDAGVPETSSPVEVQVFREAAPLVQDMLGDFQVRVTFETYCPIDNYAGLAHRDASSRVKHTDLIHFSGKRHTDKYGYRFIENEEIMVDLLRRHLGGEPRDPASYGPFWSDHLKGMQADPSLPLIHQGERGAINIRPSLPLFRKHLEGKTLDWTGSLNPVLKARGKKLADFGEVGWKPEATEAKETGDLCPADCPWCRPNEKERRR